MHDWLKRLDPAVPKFWLILLAGLVWSFIGMMLCILALTWLWNSQSHSAVFFAPLGVLLAILMQRFLFSKIALKNIHRLNLGADKSCFFGFQAWRSYLIIIFMISLGYLLRHSQFPKRYLAVIYLTIGGALFIASFHYYHDVMNSKLNIHKDNMTPHLGMDIHVLKENIITNGSFTPEKNKNIYEAYFKNAPRYSFRTVDKKYQLTNKILCDVGCSFGMNLPFCAKGSYGIEVDQVKVEFAKSIGLPIFKIDIGKEDISDLPKVEAIWCSHVLEHVDSPHIFLRKLHQLLRPDGLIILFVPTMPIIPVLQHVPFLGKLVRGYDVDDHINAFVPKSLRFFCERAGFKTIEISPFYPGFFRIYNKIPFLNRLVSRCTYIGKKIENWEYPAEAMRRADLNLNGYYYKNNQNSPD